MKKLLLMIALAATVCAFADNPFKNYHVYGGPGLAISGTVDKNQLPDSARVFLNQNYAGDSIVDCTRNFVKGTSDVKLSDGTELRFNSTGQVTYIKSGHDKSLTPQVLVDILPEATVEHLLEAGYSPYVREIRNVRDSHHRIFLLNNPMPEMIFDINGNFLITWE